MDERYEIKNGIAYRLPRYVGDLDGNYAHCDRCGGRPVVNNKCLKCDVSTPTRSAERLADLMKTCVETHHHGSRHDGTGWESTSFNANEAAKIIQACIDEEDGHLGVFQATNFDWKP